MIKVGYQNVTLCVSIASTVLYTIYLLVVKRLLTKKFGDKDFYKKDPKIA